MTVLPRTRVGAAPGKRAPSRAAQPAEALLAFARWLFKAEAHEGRQKVSCSSATVYKLSSPFTTLREYTAQRCVSGAPEVVALHKNF